MDLQDKGNGEKTSKMAEIFGLMLKMGWRNGSSFRVPPFPPIRTDVNAAEPEHEPPRSGQLMEIRTFPECHVIKRM